MQEVIRTFVRLVLFTCAGLVAITAGASHVAGVPHVIEAMAYAAVPAVLLAAVAETLLLGSERG